MRGCWIALAIVFVLGSASETPWRLYPGKAPRELYESDGFCAPNPIGGGYEDRQCTGVSSPRLIPFLVNESNPRKTDAAVIIAPGGGYALLALDKEGTDIAMWLNSIGISAFVLKYRVPQAVWRSFGGAPLDDAQRSIGILRSRAKEYGINSSRIGFMGFSAGGHLTGQISTRFEARTYPHVDAADDVSCRPDFALMLYPWKLINSKNDVTMNVTGDTPPTFLMQNEDDPLSSPKNAPAYYAALQAAGVLAELHMYPKGGHGIGRCTIKPSDKHPDYECCSWPSAAEAFLQRTGVLKSDAIAVV